MIALLKPIIPWILYTALLLIIVFAIFWRAQWSMYLLVVLAPLPALWYPLHALPLGKDTMDLLIVASLLGAIINKQGVKVPPGGWVIPLFLFVSFLSIINALITFNLTLDTGRSIIVNWKNFAEMVFLYFLVFSIFGDDKQRRVLVTLMAVIVLLIAVREFRNFSAGSSFSYEKRSAGPFFHVGLNPNHFAAFIAHSATFLLGLMLVDNNKRRRNLLALTVVFCLHPLFFAYSRGAYAAVVAVLLIYGVLKARIILVMLAILAFTWTAVLPDSVVDRISMTSNAEGQLEESAALRVQVWEKAESMFKSNPIFGIGFFSFEYALRDQVIRNSHNFWMQTAAEQGLVGLLMLSLLFVRGYYVAWRTFRLAKEPFDRGVGLGFLGCVTAVIITNIFGDRFTPFAMGCYFFIFFGLVERIHYTIGLVPQPAKLGVLPAATTATREAP